MKGSGVWLAIILIIGGAAGYALYSMQQQNQRLTYDAKLAALKLDARKQLSGLLHEDTDAYKRDIGTFLSKYFSAVDGLAKEMPELYDPERENKVSEEKKAKGKLSEENEQQRKERIDLALSLYSKMQKGDYKPLFTAADKGYRFDIYDIAKVPGAAEPTIRMSFVHWGSFGDMSYGNIDGQIKPPAPEAEAAERAKKKPELAKVIKIESSGPPILQFDPSRWVAEFVPGAEIGYYDLPQLPAEGDKMDLSFSYDLRTVGGATVQATLKFADMPIAESWKVGAGEKWDAEERVATDEELQAAGVKK